MIDKEVSALPAQDRDLELQLREFRWLAKSAWAAS